MNGGWIQRAQPLLGTLVMIGIRDSGAGAMPGAAGAQSAVRWQDALDAAFAAVAQVHRLMSFHEVDSDVSRLNRGAAAAAVGVDPRTIEVLRFARELSAQSDGAFDVTTAPQLVQHGLLPVPPAAPRPDPLATWQDIEILDACNVCFRRPLWLDLGGIAKGYAVDAAFRRLPDIAGLQRRVIAGGDLRVGGPGAQRVLLKVPGLAAGDMPAIEIGDGSVASSATTPDDGVHLDGRTGAPCATDQFVSVTAELCMVADALTKVVLAIGEASAGVLARHRATAHLHGRVKGWQEIGPAQDWRPVTGR